MRIFSAMIVLTDYGFRDDDRAAFEALGRPDLVPARVTALVHAALEGRWDEARTEHYRLYPLFRDMFIETNPIPIKAAMAMAGMIAEEYRLPLCEMSASNRKLLRDTLVACGIDLAS